MRQRRPRGQVDASDIDREDSLPPVRLGVRRCSASGDARAGNDPVEPSKCLRGQIDGGRDRASVGNVGGGARVQIGTLEPLCVDVYPRDGGTTGSQPGRRRRADS